MKSVYGDKSSDAWKKLKGRVLITAPGWSEAYALFTKGEVPIVFSYVTSPAYHMIEEKTDKYPKIVIVDMEPGQAEDNHSEIFKALLAMDLSKMAQRSQAEAFLQHRGCSTATRELSRRKVHIAAA